MKVILEGKEFDLSYEEQLKCSEETINEDLKNQPSLFAWYAVLQELAEAKESQAKVELEVVDASLDAKFRNELKDAKATETIIRNKVILDDLHLEKLNELNQAKKEVGILRAIVAAFSHRKDILISLASNMRVSADPELWIKKKEVAATLKPIGG